MPGRGDRAKGCRLAGMEQAPADNVWRVSAEFAG
jgi:hypothetical protein